MSKEENKTLPKLRFPEFKDEHTYKKYLFTDVFLFSTGKGIKQQEAHPDFKIPCVRYGELYHMYDEVIYKVINRTNLDKSELRFSKGNEILLPSAGEDPLDIGSASALTIKDVAIGRTINVLRPLKKNIYSQIYVSYFINQKFRRKISTLAKGSSISNVYNSDLKKLEIVLPSLNEQQKIASCLSSLDNVITAETEKLDLLKDHKKGLLQQLFPAKGETQPKFRFPEFKNDGDWEETILDKICSFSKGKGLPKSAITENGTKPCVHYGQLFTVYAEVINNIKSFTNMENGVLSKENDVLMPTSDVTPKGLAKASCIKEENVVLGGDILIIRPDTKKVLGEFLSRYIRHLENEVLKLVSGSTVFHLYSSSMKLLELYLPSIKEQKKIANCLSSVDDLIEAQTQNIKALKKHRKGLMQQLFPDVNNMAI